jgi:hypothetical protein
MHPTPGIDNNLTVNEIGKSPSRKRSWETPVIELLAASDPETGNGGGVEYYNDGLGDGGFYSCPMHIYAMTNIGSAYANVGQCPAAAGS